MIKIADIVGSIAATLTTIAFVPQVIQTVKTKSTTDISLGMFSCFTVGVFFWLLYGIFLKSIPIMFANTCTIILSGIVLSYKLKYK